MIIDRDNKVGFEKNDIENFVFNNVFLDEQIILNGKKYTVEKFYPYHVSMKDSFGHSESFQYVEIFNAVNGADKLIQKQICVAV